MFSPFVDFRLRELSVLSQVFQDLRLQFATSLSHLTSWYVADELSAADNCKKRGVSRLLHLLQIESWMIAHTYWMFT